MKKLLITGGLVFLGIAPGWSQVSGMGDSPEDVQRIIEDKNTKLEDWYSQGVLDSVVNIFALDVIQMPPHHDPIRGREAFRKNWEQSFGYGTWDFDFEVEEVKLSGDQAVELGNYSLEFTPKGNSPIPEFEDRGNYLALWEKQDGDWKIVWEAPVSTKSPREMMEEMQQMKQGTKEE